MKTVEQRLARLTLDQRTDIDELRAENERLRRELKLAWKDSDVIHADAERYRWLRQHRIRMFVDDRDGNACLLFDHGNPKFLDAAIDAARETE